MWQRGRVSDLVRRRLPTRVAAACGVAAPVAFVGGWFVNGLRTDGYDPLTQAISQLAREGAPTRTSMTLAFIAFGVLIPFWAPTLAGRLRAPALVPAVVTAGLATLAVAALPLTREPGGTQDVLHALVAGIGYVAMALTPLLAAPALWRLGHRSAGAISVLVGLTSAVCLVSTLAAEASGLYQRLGLGVVDLWHVVLAVLVFAGRLRGPPP